MELCFYSKKRKMKTYALLGGSAALGLVFFSAFVYAVFAIVHETLNAKHAIAAAFYVVLGLAPVGGLVASSVAMFWLGIKNYWIYSRKYHVHQNGLTVAYCNGTTVAYPWENIADVCVCDVNHNYGGGFDMVIRFGTCTEANGPLTSRGQFGIDGYDKWRNEWYLFSHYKEVIYVEYSPQRLATISGVYPKIRDRRTRQDDSYSISWPPEDGLSEPY